MNKEKIETIKTKILEEEKNSLANINPTEDAQMIITIMKIYEEECDHDNK